MSLSSTLSLAQSALANSSAQSAILSSNIANVNNANYSRRTAGAITQIPGAVFTGATQRATDSALLASLLSAQSQSASSQVLSDGLTKISNTLGLDISSTTSDAAATDQSPATLISNLANALQQYGAEPDQTPLATAAISAANTLASNLNQASTSVQTVRQQADDGIAASVKTINSLLTQFKAVNDSVTKGTAIGADVSNDLDTRDGILKQLSSQIGVTTVTGVNNSMSIYTDSGVTLFETNPRTVSFTPSNAYSATTTGQPVTIDGVPVTGSSAIMPISSGTLAGLAQLRDTTAPAYQNQLDQIASSLISTFAEASAGNPTVAGLFVSPTLGPSLPTSANTAGLASTIAVNAAVNPSVGGVATNLRDGITYNYNTTNSAAFSARLQQLSSALGATQTFNPSSGGTSSGSLATYAQSSVSWLETTRQTATNDASYKSTVVSTTTTALSNATGVNLDDEMAKMLDIEHAYQASAQILNTVKSMYASLLSAFN